MAGGEDEGISRSEDLLSAFLTSRAKSRRGIQESEYAFWAAMELEEHLDECPALAELIGPPVPRDGPMGDFNIVGKTAIATRHLGILAELGRILKTFADGKPACLKLALEWVEMADRPPVKRYAKLLRRHRLRGLGRPIMEAVGDAKGLAVAINAAVIEYLRKNPATEPRDILVAIEAMYNVYSERLEFATSQGPDPRDERSGPLTPHHIPGGTHR
jgi:hypothetical protein